MRCTPGESGKETSWSQTLNNWNRWTLQNSTRKDNAKEVWTPMRGDIFKFPVADGTVKIQNFLKRAGSENIHLHPVQPRQSKKIFKENQTGLLQPYGKTHRGMMAKLGMISWSISGTSFSVITRNPDSYSTCRLKNHSFFPLKYIDVTRTTDTTLDVMLKKSVDDFWNVDWDRELSDTWIGFTRPYFTEWKATRSIFMIRQETDEETNDLKTRDCVARYVEAYVKKRPFAWDIGHSRAHQGPLSMTWWGIDSFSPCHFGSRAISWSNVHGVFLVHERFCFFALSKCLGTNFLFAAFASVFMATYRACEDAMHTSLPGLPPLSWNVGYPNGSGHDLDGMGHRSIDAQFKELRVILLPLAWIRRFWRPRWRPSVKPWVWSPPELPVLNRPSMPSLPRWRCLQQWNRTSVS